MGTFTKTAVLSGASTDFVRIRLYAPAEFVISGVITSADGFLYQQTKKENGGVGFLGRRHSI